MKNATDVMLALHATNSRLDKEAIVERAWRLGITEFFQGAKIAHEPLKTYGIKKVPLVDEGTPGTQTATFTQFQAIIDKLAERELTGHAARDAVADFINGCAPATWNNFYRRVILKDLACGCTATTINKVLEELGKTDPECTQYITEPFAVSLASPVPDTKEAKLLVGKKMLDVKLDGVRIVAVLDKERDDVTLYTRGGRVNTNFEHLQNALRKVMNKLAVSMVFDGEMMAGSFQELMRQLNRSAGKSKTTEMKFALFDMLPLVDFAKGRCEMSQRDRHALLTSMEGTFQEVSGGAIYVIPKVEVDLDTPEGKVAFREFNMEALRAGLEGIMVKDPESAYIADRALHWLKIKPFVDVDLEIYDLELGKAEKRNANRLGNVLVRGWVHDPIDGEEKYVEVSCGNGFDDGLRDEIWADRPGYMGRIIELRCDVFTLDRNEEVNGTKGTYQGKAYDRIWSARFPRFMRFRDTASNPGVKI